ncbi:MULTISPECIES: hypothetical protein [Amycolatopsis]|uniref:Uncharacterized protein n=3 Tax=Amycolatopsis TaxID=1813 RepID=A0A2P2FXH5_AMYLU|nr:MULTISPECIES: hypothetical protein [Amycolatopsis]RSN12000.1 hypothetical protein DMC63_29150 [Streptomyces sp. WAC 05977]KFU81429.1 hypothetical protein BB31_11205 [Amycolatopsis lurida NRRL 2430]MBE1575945.1 hypothetical protein [Amycolatopsis roodepoortensis]QXV61841.1 hypothetical protein CVV72_35860 [Amycolatopsis sp. TNS106]RSN65724.1 hypothetical protein DMH01_05045 [Amycolatopsis sp. WAC 04182]
MTNQDWRRERRVRTVDTEGNPADVIVGLVETPGNGYEAALRVDGGPGVLLPLYPGADLLAAVRQTIEDGYRASAH